MRRLLFMLASAIAMPVVPAFDAQLAAGLAVTVDGIQEPVVVDGVAMQVQRATGEGVPELARRIESQWRSQGSDVRTLQQQDWILRSRMNGMDSEVVQWRRTQDKPELLWSALNASSPVRGTPDTGLILPAACSWGRSVSGRAGMHHYLQRSARCTLPVDRLSSLLQRSLPSQGWSVRTKAAGSLLVSRPGFEGLISLVRQQGDAATWLGWLRMDFPP